MTFCDKVTAPPCGGRLYAKMRGSYLDQAAPFGGAANTLRLDVYGVLVREQVVRIHTTPNIT